MTMGSTSRHDSRALNRTTYAILNELYQAAGSEGLTLQSLRLRTGVTDDQLKSAVSTLCDAGIVRKVSLVPTTTEFPTKKRLYKYPPAVAL